MDAGQGIPNNEATWDDTDVARLDTIPAAQLHRNVDGPILAADKEGQSSQHASTPQRVYLRTFKRVRQGILVLPSNNLWLRYWKAGGFGCSEHTLDPNPDGGCQ